MKWKLLLGLMMILSCFCLVYAQSDTENRQVISVSLVNQDPDPAISGDILEVRLGIQNLGGVAVDNLIVEIVPEYPFEVLPGEPAFQKVGSVMAYQSGYSMKIIKYRLKVNRDTPAGTYDLKIKYYEEGSTQASEKSLPIDVQSKESAEVIYIDKTTLVPGKQTGLKFTVNNVGGSPLKDLTFKWINEDKIILPVGSDNTKYIKYIDIGESADLEYQVIADSNADAGLYELNLYLAYEDPVTKEEKTISTIAGVYVGGETDFDVSFSESSSGSTSFSIANIGSNPAFSVSVIIPQQRGWRVTGSNSVIIGNLNKGDYTVASFSLQSAVQINRTAGNRTATGAPSQDRQQFSGENFSQNVLVQIAYTDTMGERRIIEKSVQMNAQSFGNSTSAFAAASSTRRNGSVQSQNDFSGYYIPALVVIAVIAFFAYRRYRKKKHSESAAKRNDFSGQKGLKSR